MSWTETPMWGFDLETTGRDPHEARIASAALISPEGEVTTWLVDPGVEMPAEAQAVHGLSAEYLAAEGVPSAEAVPQITEAILRIHEEGLGAVVGHNVSYDLTVLAREASRVGLIDQLAAFELDLPPIFDTIVLDKAHQEFRRGKRTLAATAAHYGVRLDNAHDADSDARASLGIAQAIAEAGFRTGDSAETLHGRQIVWKAAQSQNLQDYLRRMKGDPQLVVEGRWPVQIKAG